MWNAAWRERIWSDLDQPWDMIVIGGGITGAGILREAQKMGLRALLVEAGDFASGTSSRSSKMVHGGFRYLKNFQFKLTFDSVRERELLLQEGRGLVNPLGFLLANYKTDAMPAWIFQAGLLFYDLLALKWGHRHYDLKGLRELCPLLDRPELCGGFRYIDAQTDDARLVLRILREAAGKAGTCAALNYARVVSLLRLRSGSVCGVVLQDNSLPGTSSARTVEVKASIVVNASGAWADDLRQQVGGKCRLRKLRGSHLILPFARLPVSRAVSFSHPKDGRFVFVLPWEGVTLIGTTDVDHSGPIETVQISPAETEYLLDAARFAFPVQELSLSDIQGTFAGVRPVVDSGKADPCKESREHVLWKESGLLTVAGGKLTTFRLMARDALRTCTAAILRGRRDKVKPSGKQNRVLEDFHSELLGGLPPGLQLRLAGRYGEDAPRVADCAQPGEMDSVPGSPTPWAELRWAARAEGALHLDDLLLRRTRLGLLLPEGALSQADRIRSIVQPEIGWSDERWEAERTDYTILWKKCYHL
jgi:glycerol-3-phosphate dehydrogenase